MVSNWIAEGRNLRDINIKRLMGVRTEPLQAAMFVPGLAPNPAMLLASSYQSKEAISKQFTLNPKQDAAYALVADEDGELRVRAAAGVGVSESLFAPSVPAVFAARLNIVAALAGR